MKSNLVDALRRAQEEKSDTTLSDSGSFDATQQAFTAPANQDVADVEFGEDAAELELMSTTRGLAVNDVDEVPDVGESTNIAEAADQVAEQMPAQFGKTMANATVWLTDSDCVVPESGSLMSMPGLARHVPVICLVLALLAGAGWQAYQHLGLTQNSSALGAFGVPSRIVGPQEIAQTDEPAVRFRYLNGPLTVGEDEAAQ